MGQEGIAAAQAMTPERWAHRLSHILNTVLGANRFPVQVPEIAVEYSRQVFPDDPISLVVGDRLPGFDGALMKAPPGKKGWGIVYNTAISSLGRINFTLAHEFGHYLLHRLQHPEGFSCGEQDVVRWDSAYGQLEHQANVFAATVLMPLDDFRRQIDPQARVDLDMLGHCADRYRVSLIAATLRWLQYTQRRAVLVVARDGFILWARSSAAALRSGAYFRTSRGPVPVPSGSIAASARSEPSNRTPVDVGPCVWFDEPCSEMTVFSEAYDFTLSLIQLGAQSRTAGSLEPLEEPVPDVTESVRWS